MTLFKRTQKHIHTIIIGSAIGLLLLSGVISYINTLRLISDSQWVAHTHQVEAELQGIHATLNKMVLDLRGFLLTGDERFNTYTKKSSNALLNHFRIALELTQDNPVQQNRLQKLKPLLDSRVTMVHERINLRRNKGIGAAVGVVNQNSGDTLDEQIRILVNKMEEMEKALLIDRQAKLKDSNNSSFMALTLSGSIGLGLILLVLSGLKRQIAERSKTEEEKSLAAVAFDTHDAIMITDSSPKIIRVNPAFCRITGYKEEDVIGHNPRILNSGRHDKEFYHQMWQELFNNGTWSGEVCDRHKSGQIYPKQLTISAVKNRADITTKYVAIFNDISERKKTEEEIHQLAFYDALTELPNRRLLLDRLDFALLTSERNKQFGGLLFLDLDNFKSLNDALGHVYGDMLLVEVAERIKLSVRNIDTVSRFGGDEFVVLIEESGIDKDDATQNIAQLAEKIRATLATPYQLNENTHFSSPSIGATLFLGKDESINDLIKQADMAMYKAKEGGRNRVRFYDPVMQRSVESRASLEQDLRNALLDHQLILFYQIQLDHNRKPLGAESLVRWKHPIRGMVSPADFIPIAEESSLILDLGYWILDVACQQLALWNNNAKTRDLTLAVNISAQQFKQPDFVEIIVGVIKKHHIEASHLKLELTESIELEDIDTTVMKMLALKNVVGVTLSLDDFGTGYSSLSYLKRLSLHQLKIDQSFVRDMTEDNNDAKMVKTIIDMANNFNLEVIAEGVETEEQFSLLKEYGCMGFQGYLFSKPVPINEFEALLKDN